MMDCEACGGPIVKREGAREIDYRRAKTCSPECYKARLNEVTRIREARHKQVSALKRNRLASGWNDIQRFISGYIPLT